MYAGYAAEVLPGVNEALDRKDTATFNSEAAALAAALRRASARLDEIAQRRLLAPVAVTAALRRDGSRCTLHHGRI